MFAVSSPEPLRDRPANFLLTLRRSVILGCGPYYHGKLILKAAKFVAPALVAGVMEYLRHFPGISNQPGHKGRSYSLENVHVGHD